MIYTSSSLTRFPFEEAFNQPLPEGAICGPHVVYPFQCLHERVELHAQQRPEELAVLYEYEDGQVCRLSYRQLDCRANALAHDLLGDRGVHGGDLVGVCVDLSVEGILAFLALNKIGAAPYFLDPQTPPERLDFLLSSAGVRLLLIQPPCAQALFAFPDTADDTKSRLRACMSMLDRRSVEREYAQSPQIAVSPDAIVYAIATSGTTGDPKGVPIRYASLANYSSALADLYAVKPGDRILEMFSFHFDAAIEQMALAFFAGATLCLGPRRVLSSGPSIQAFLQRHDIHHAAFTPSILAELPPASLPALRSIECGGQRCSRALIEQWAPGRRFINIYGPTEATIGATYAQCQAGAEGEVPIGHPLPNTWIGILDVNDPQRLLPFEEVGEIVIGGAGVSPGYINRPELTSSQFITLNGVVCYRTGDLGLIKDGELWYRGRREGDLEVKLSGGRRFNLGEVETRLLELPAILSCAVGVWESRIVAYLVARQNAPHPSRAEIQEYLKRWLPAYAVPNYYQWVSTLPMNSNGKIARGSLPTPDWRAFLREGEFVVPKTPTECLLAERVAQIVFPAEPARGEMNAAKTFSELGLDSLSATDFLLSVQPYFKRAGEIDEARLLRLTLIELARQCDEQQTLTERGNV